MNNAYKMVTDLIIKKLEAGTIPWKKPWSGFNIPINAISKKQYRGINRFLLDSSRYDHNIWLTFKQAQQVGGSVRRGEKGRAIVFWKMIDSLDSDGDIETRPMMRGYTVFNIDQCEGLDSFKQEILLEYKIKTLNWKPITEAEKIVRGYKGRPPILKNSSGAFYLPFKDVIEMPKKSAFHSETDWYSCLFHEMGHSTGHQKRLNRKSIADVNFAGSPDYAKEELVAELTSCFLCEASGVGGREISNSAAYIKGWLGKLKSDPNLLPTAAQQAQKAADYILGTRFNA